MSCLIRAFSVALVLLAWAAAPVGAQSDLRPLLDKIDRLERDLSVLQRQVYRGQAPSTVPGTAADASLDSNVAVALQQRLNALENEMRNLTGKIEEQNFLASQTATRLERMQKDVELRFTELEQKAQAGAGQPQAQAPAQTQVTLPAAGAAPADAGGDKIVLRPPPGVLAPPPPESPADRAAPARPAPAVTLKPPAPVSAAPGPANPQDQYDQALGLLRANDFEGAEKAFQGFVAANPQHELAGNAQYWLGETHYVRGDHQKAAVVFAEGYQKYPKSPKAADNLLKLGLSLSGMGQKKEACTTFARLAKDFPNTADSVKRRASAERQRLGCN